MKKRKKFILIVLALIFLSPVLITSFLMNKYAVQIPKVMGTVNKGFLMQPAIHVTTVLVNAQNADLTKNHWYIVLITRTPMGPQSAIAAALLDKISRVRLALGKDYSQTGVLMASVDPGSMPGATLANGYMALTSIGVDQLLGYVDTEQGIFIMDPRGFIVLAYPSTVESESIYKDLTRLMKYGNVD